MDLAQVFLKNFRRVECGEISMNFRKLTVHLSNLLLVSCPAFLLLHAASAVASCESKILDSSSSGDHCTCEIKIDGQTFTATNLSVAECNSYCQVNDPGKLGNL